MDYTDKNAFLSLMKNAMSDAERCHKYALSPKSNANAVLSYASTALSYCLSAESLFYAHYDDLCHSELPELFQLFKTFVHEAQNNCVTDHSHQWTDIEFERLKELFDNSVCAQPISE